MPSLGTDDPAGPAQLEQCPPPTLVVCCLANLQYALHIMLHNGNTKCHAVMIDGKAGRYQKQHHPEAAGKGALQECMPGERRSFGGLSDTK